MHSPQNLTRGAIQAMIQFPEKEADKPHILQVLDIKSIQNGTNQRLSFK